MLRLLLLQHCNKTGWQIHTDYAGVLKYFYWNRRWSIWLLRHRRCSHAAGFSCSIQIYCSDLINYFFGAINRVCLFGKTLHYKITRWVFDFGPHGFYVKKERSESSKKYVLLVCWLRHFLSNQKLTWTSPFSSLCGNSLNACVLFDMSLPSGFLLGFDLQHNLSSWT